MPPEATCDGAIPCSDRAGPLRRVEPDDNGNAAYACLHVGMQACIHELIGQPGLDAVQ